MVVLTTPEGKKVVTDEKDVCLYSSARNPPNTGTAYTRGKDLYAHRAKSGKLYFYTYSWSMWQGEGHTYRLITEEEAQEFLLSRAELSDWNSISPAEKEKILEIWPDFFEETA